VGVAVWLNEEVTSARNRAAIAAVEATGEREEFFMTTEWIFTGTDAVWLRRVRRRAGIKSAIFTRGL
jgi:hypothetical protein